MAKARCSMNLDVCAAFHCIRIAEGEEWKGCFEWLVCPFGLTGDTLESQHWINTMLGDALDEFCSAYMDDVIIYKCEGLA